jgi:hypothetical protein
VSGIFQSAQKFWAKMKFFLNLYKGPKIIRQHKLNFPKCPKVLGSNEFFNPYDLAMHPEFPKTTLKVF